MKLSKDDISENDFKSSQGLGLPVQMAFTRVDLPLIFFADFGLPNQNGIFMRGLTLMLARIGKCSEFKEFLSLIKLIFFHFCFIWLNLEVRAKLGKILFFFRIFAILESGFFRLDSRNDFS